MKPVAIIGGGITGLTAALQLRSKNIPFVLYEAAPRCGGVIQTVHQDGFIAECGPNTILETAPLIGKLVADAGLESSKRYSAPEANDRYIVRNGGPVSLPGSPLGFFATPLFSIGAKLRLLKEPFIARGMVEESLGQFVLRRLGQEFLDYAINPFVAGIFAGDPNKLSVRYAFPKLHALEQRYGSLIRGQILGARERKRSGSVSKQNAKKLSFNGGLVALTDALASTLKEDIQLNSTVRCLERTGAGWTAHLNCASSSESREHSRVLLVAPAHKLAQIELRGCGRASLSSLGKIRYSPVASVSLGFRRAEVAHSLSGFGVLIPEIERFNILGSIFASSLFPERAPEGCVLLTNYVGGARAPHLADETTDRLVAITVADLRRMLGVSGSPIFQHVTVYRHAIPQYEMDFGTHLQNMNDIEQHAPGLLLQGHYRDGTGLSDSILSGYKAADRIAESIASNSSHSQPIPVAA